MELIPTIRSGEIGQHRLSVMSLLAVNVLPLVGVLFFGWNTFNVVFVYWLENVIIGVINLLKILTCKPDPKLLAEKVAERNPQADETEQQKISEAVEEFQDSGQTAMQLSKLFFAPFFTVHYGGFCFGHGIFVCAMLGDGGPFRGGGPLELLGDAFQGGWFWLTAIGLFTSHLLSYFTNFLGRGEYRHTAPPEQMFAPYPRIFVLHIAIVLSGFFVVMLGQPVVMLLLLVIGKTVLDLAMHLREHRSPEAPHRVE